MRHWTSLAKRQKVRRQLSAATLGIRERSDQAKRGTRELLTLAAKVFVGVALVLLLVVAIEALAIWLNHFFRWGSLFRPVPEGTYETFVGAAVGAQATFLALFFATVGVIASTAYARVPGEIRQLFVRERTSTIYVLDVVIALVVGIALLAFPIVSSREFHGLTVMLFVLLSLFSVLSLVILGRRLFNFFDPSALTERLYPEFVRSARSASASGKNLPDEAEQKSAHNRAATVLRQYEQLVTLISTREIQDSTAPQKISYQLLGCWELASAVKSSIPVNSEWFLRTASHPNWLTLEHNRLSTALETRTGVQPSLAPDPLWLERRLCSLIGALLPSLATSNDWTPLIAVLDDSNQVIFSLAKRLQVEEALLLLNAVGGYRERALATVVGKTSEDQRMFQLALAEREVLGYTSLWLGLARPFEFLNLENLTSSFGKAVESTTNAYKAGAPRELLSLFEDIASGIAFERKVESERITPDWWVQHLCGRVLTSTIKNAVDTFIDEVETKLIAPLVTESDSDAEFAAVRIFDLLELIHKVEYHLSTVHRALDSIQSLRHEPTGDELWPDAVLPDAKPRALEEQLLLKLGSVALNLPSTPHDKAAPDLFGQAYRRLFDATFHAIVEGHDEVARQLFPATLAIADRARQRLAHDLAGERVRQQAIFGTEPLVDIMELSGYALLMSRINDAGIWSTVQTIWDSILDAGTASELAVQLAAILTLQENVFAVTSGGVGRSSRQIELTRILRARGIENPDRMWGESYVEPHADPIVATFAPEDSMGIYHQLADLFIAEYLALRPNLSGLQLPRGAQMLRDSIEHRRQRSIPANEDDGGIDDDS